MRVHSFLAITEPIPAEALVVEGWLPNYVLAEAKAEFERNHYAKLYVTGVALESDGELLYENNTYADVGAASLIRIGMSKDFIQAIPAPLIQQDRTYTSAVALKNWLQQHAAGETRFNVVSVGTHARRSRLLFQKAFGKHSLVGIIAIEDRDYNPDRWWEFSQGVRQVIDELFAYIYAKIAFAFV